MLYLTQPCIVLGFFWVGIFVGFYLLFFILFKHIIHSCISTSELKLSTTNFTKQVFLQKCFRATDVADHHLF